ncbi:MAG: serine hydrolase, partial [Gemmatimonadetes bacterium]|nr:serine hydrolase [Gemmatimonadota bacterium]
AVRAATDSLRRLPLPPLVAARVERGMGAAFAGATELPSPAGLAVLADADLAGRAGTVAAAEAKALGIDLVFTGGSALPADTAALPPVILADSGGAAWAAYVHALADGGRLPVITAFAAPASSPGDTVVRLARWDRSALETAQLGWLDAAVKAGAAGVQPGFAAIPALTGDSTPLPFSGVAISGVLRRDMGFGGLVIADVSAEGSLARRWGAVASAISALREGADLLAGVDDAGAMADSLAAAVQAGRLSAGVVDDAVRRIFAAKRRAELGIPPTDTVRPPFPAKDAAATASEAFERTTAVLGPAPALKGCRKPILISTPDADVRVLSAELARRVPGILHLRTHAVARHGSASGLRDFAANDADCAVVAAMPGEPVRVVERLGSASSRDTSKAARRDTARFRADSVGFARDTASRRIVYIALAMEPSRALPDGAATVVLAWGAGAQAQRAAVRALFGEVRRPAEEVVHPRVAWPASRRLVPATSAKDVGMSADSLAHIDAVLQRGIDGGVFTAAAVAVGRHGKLVKLRGFGSVGGHPVDPGNTLFDLASLTKVIGTTAAVMALVDDGKVRLDEPVYHYLPKFRGGGRGDVTVWNLMTHTGGLPAGDDLYGETADPDAALQKVYRTDLVYEPGTKMVYSDFGMILMAEVVRRRAGEPVDVFAARRVFVPLGM